MSTQLTSECVWVSSANLVIYQLIKRFLLYSKAWHRGASTHEPEPNLRLFSEILTFHPLPHPS